jgi:hypothetical protein
MQYEQVAWKSSMHAPYSRPLFWILGKGLRRALIRCTLGSGKSKKGLGFWRGGHKGAMGNKGEQFTDNLGLRWTTPVTTGGCQVSRKGG